MKQSPQRKILRRLAATALLWGTCLSANAQGQPESIDSQANEVRIMARVLNDSMAPVLRREEGGPEADHAPPILEPLESPDMGGAVKGSPQEVRLRGPVKGSPFEVRRPPVSGNYIPTVGAVFSVRVNFPLSEPPAPGEQKPVESRTENPDDLWLRNSQERPMVDDFVQRVGPSGFSDMGEGPGGPHHPGPEYDPQRVAELRTALIDTLARYGHRMASLKDDERIVLVVSTAHPTNVFTLRRPAEGQNKAGNDNPRRILVKQMAGALAGGREEIVLSFRKSDLKEAMEGRQLEGKMIERHVRSETHAAPPIFGDGNPPMPPPHRN